MWWLVDHVQRRRISNQFIEQNTFIYLYRDDLVKIGIAPTTFKHKKLFWMNYVSVCDIQVEWSKRSPW